MFVNIVGTSRCGTTLLQQMMHEHPALVVFRETHWLPKMFEFFGTQKVPAEWLLDIAEKTTWVQGEDLLSVNLAYSDFASKQELLTALRAEFRNTGYLTIQEFSAILVRVLFGWQGYWGDKTPDYGFYMGMIQTLWPECRFIHIVRDGVATARSMSRHPGCQLMLSAGVHNWCSLSYDRLCEHYQTAVFPLEDYIASWRIRLNRIRDESRRLKKGTYLELRYQDLLQEPRITLANICAFLDLSAPGEWLDSCSKRIKPRASVPAIASAQYYRLQAEDLLALNRQKSGAMYAFLSFPVDIDDHELSEMLEKAEHCLNADRAREALDLAIQMMATYACHQQRSRLMKAHELAIMASRQCREDQIAQHWCRSAGEYGFFVPDSEYS